MYTDEDRKQELELFEEAKSIAKKLKIESVYNNNSRQS